MSTDSFDITKLSDVFIAIKRLYSNDLRTSFNYDLYRIITNDNGVFVKGEKIDENCNYSKARC